MSVQSRLSFLLPLFLVFFSHQIQAQKTPPPNDDEIVRVETRIVTVPVGVTDKNGRFITNLKEENFRVAEDKVAQEIAFFEGEDAPFTVALMLDVSDSTASKFADTQKSAAAFLDQLRPQDKVILISFNKYVYQLTTATADRDLLKKQIAELQTGGGTSVYDSMDFIYKEFGRIRGRKAVVLFTDGVDTASRATYQETLKQAQRLDALIYTIRYETMKAVSKDLLSKVPVEFPVRMMTAKGESLKIAYERATIYLKFLADNSGGRYFLADTPDNLVKTFELIADELRHQYSIGYYPSNDSSGKEVRRIKVSVDVPNAQVKARKSYVYKGAVK